MLIAYNEATGEEVKPGDRVRTSRNNPATLRRATRARTNRSGRVYVEWPNGGVGEYYDRVFGLTVREVP